MYLLKERVTRQTLGMGLMREKEKKDFLEVVANRKQLISIFKGAEGGKQLMERDRCCQKRM